MLWNGAKRQRVVLPRAGRESSARTRSGHWTTPRGMLTFSPRTGNQRGGGVTEKEVRLDKWLHIARVFKTRAQARRACDLNRVQVNGAAAKAHRKLAIDDRVEAELRDWTRILVVKELHDRPLPKKEVPRLFEDLSPPRPTLDPLDRLMRRTPVERGRGLGRPSKRERRHLERLRDR